MPPENPPTPRLLAVAQQGKVRLLLQPAPPTGNTTRCTLRRRRHPDFVFGVNYARYFDDPQHLPDEVVYVGPMPPQGWVDEHIRLGETCSYTCEVESSETLLGPVPVKLRDERVWWPIDTIQASMDRIAHERADRVQLQTYGQTRAGHPIRGLTAGNRDRIVGFTGLIHAGEAGPELLLPVLERLLREDASLLERCGVTVLPAVNLDERDRLVRGVPYYLRTNAAGVDLNRNFDGRWDVTDYAYDCDTSDPTSSTYRGPRPHSEPETLAVVSWVEQHRPAAVFALHWLASVTGDRLLGSKFFADDPAYVARCESLRAAFSEGFESVPSGFGGSFEKPKVVEYVEPGGSMPTWAYERLGIPAFDVEHYNDQEGQVCRFDHTSFDYLTRYQQRYHAAIRRLLQHVAET